MPIFMMVPEMVSTSLVTSRMYQPLTNSSRSHRLITRPRCRHMNPTNSFCSRKPRSSERAHNRKDRAQVRMTTMSNTSRKLLSSCLETLGCLHSWMWACVSRRIGIRPLCAVLSNVIRTVKV